MSKVKIEIATLDDVPAIAELAYQTGKTHEDAYPDYFKPSSVQGQASFVQKAIDGEYSHVFKAVLDNIIIGYLVLYIWDRPKEYFVYSELGYIGSLGVDEKYRHQGIGTKLIHAAESWCKEHNIGAIELDVFAFNDSAEQLYAHLGYREIKHNRMKILK